MSPSIDHIKEWCEHMKLKIMVVRKINMIVPEKQLVNVDWEIIWENWKAFKVEYIHQQSLHESMGTKGTTLTQKAKKNKKKSSLYDRKIFLYTYLCSAQLPLLVPRVDRIIGT